MSIEDNIRAIAKYKGIQIGTMEDVMGVSHGYLSRSKNMSAMTLYRASQFLGVRMESLIEDEYEEFLAKQRIRDQIAELKIKLAIMGGKADDEAGNQEAVVE